MGESLRVGQQCVCVPHAAAAFYSFSNYNSCFLGFLPSATHDIYKNAKKSLQTVGKYLATFLYRYIESYPIYKFANYIIRS